MQTVNALVISRNRNGPDGVIRPARSYAGNGRGEMPAGVRKAQAALEIFSAARLMRPEIGAKASVASLLTASVFFEL